MNRMILLGIKHFEGTTKEGRPYSFDSLAFIEDVQPDNVRGAWPVIANPTKDIKINDLVPGRQYEVFGIFSNSKFHVNYLREV